MAAHLSCVAPLQSSSQAHRSLAFLGLRRDWRRCTASTSAVYGGHGLSLAPSLATPALAAPRWVLIHLTREMFRVQCMELWPQLR